MKTIKRILAILLTAQATLSVSGATEAVPDEDSVLLGRMFTYAHRAEPLRADSSTHAYLRFLISTDRRNVLLLAVPTMYGIAHGGARQFAGEAIDRISTDSTKQIHVERVMGVNTIRHGRSALSTLTKYLTPTIYGETILEGNLLSPFHGKNRRFYRYHFIYLDAQKTRITFRPRVGNTQLVSGRATIDNATGRIIETNLYGEFDMIRFRLTVEMEKNSLLPARCDLKSRFRFLGNRISADYALFYHMDVPDSLSAQKDYTPVEIETLMEKIRPEPLPGVERRVIDDYCRDWEARQRRKNSDTAKVSRRESQFWSSLGSTILHSTRSYFGANDEGFLRINPILNPLYFGYSNSKGLVYKFDIKAGYSFSPNCDVTVKIKPGYSFKQRQFYYSLPIRFNYNKNRNGFIAIDINHGRHLYNEEIKKQFSQEIIDSLHNIGQRFDYFRDTDFDFYGHHDISDYWSIDGGIAIHRRKSLSQQAFKSFGLDPVFHSTAPRVKLQYRPLGWKGPAVTLDYERGIKGIFKSDNDYERWEIDASYIHEMPRLQSWSMRLGGGFYTQRADKQYFLDFANFRENNLHGGWNDRWSGDFDLLDSEWYNSSNYYARANFTYESPLMLTSHFPGIGHFVEMERVYFGGVVAQELHPYMELGYGLTTRLFSIGIFAGGRNCRFERVGCSFGFELFRKW